MTSESQPTFSCKVCANVLEPRFLPSAPPSCPSCGADTQPNQAAIDAQLTVFCPSCHAKNSVYEHDNCSSCGAAWGNWSGSEAVEQSPESAIENDRVLYKSSRGPEGGTTPRW